MESHNLLTIKNLNKTCNCNMCGTAKLNLDSGMMVVNNKLNHYCEKCHKYMINNTVYIPELGYYKPFKQFISLKETQNNCELMYNINNKYIIPSLNADDIYNASYDDMLLLLKHSGYLKDQHEDYSEEMLRNYIFKIIIKS